MATRPGTDEHRRVGLARTATGPELPNVEHRLHDAIDLASGRIETTDVSGPLTAAVRVKRLSELGFGTDLSVSGGPMYRLTAQTPYQSAPEAWLDAFDGTYGAGPGVARIWWRLPPSFPTEFMAGCNFSFSQLP